MNELNSNRAAFLAELRRRLAVISPRTQLARFQLTAQIAQEFGLIFRAEITGHAGLGASLLRSGFDLSVPFSINQNSSEGSVFTPREIALRFNFSSADASIVSFGLSTSGVTFDGLDAFQNIDANALSSLLFGNEFDGTSAQALIENEGRFIIRAEGAISGLDNEASEISIAGARRGVEVGIVGDVNYDFVFWEPTAFFANQIEPIIRDIVHNFNENRDRLEDKIAIEAQSIVSLASIRFNQATASNNNVHEQLSNLESFKANFIARSFVDLFKAAEIQNPAITSFQIGLPSSLGGSGQQSGAGAKFAEIGRNESNPDNFYIITRETPLLGTHSENQATSITRFHGVNEQGENIVAPSVVEYNYALTLGPQIGVDYEKGADFVNPNGQGNIANTGPFDSSAELLAFIGGYEQAYKGSCFVAGTQILLANGKTKPIEEIKIGDKVLSFDPTRKKSELSEDDVSNIFQRIISQTLILNDLETTHNHRIYTHDRGFIEAKDIELGDYIVDGNGSNIQITSKREVGEEKIVYNFSVRRNHTYVAGGYRVHNDCLKLDGSDGFVNFFPDGSSLGIFFDGADGLKITNHNKGQKTAQLIEIDRSKIKTSVWEDIDDALGVNPNSPEELQAVNLPLTRNGVTEIKILEAYSHDVAVLAKLDYTGSVGSIIGGALGATIFNDNPLERIVGSTVFSVIGENIAEFFENSASFNIDLKLDTSATIFDDLGTEFASAGIGAVSSYLVSELIGTVGVEGFSGEILNTGAGSVIGKIISNIADIGDPTGIFSGVNPALIGNAFGSFLGSKLASEITTFGSIGGQLGTAIGASLGVIAVTAALAPTAAAAAAAAVAGTTAASTTLIGAQLGAFAGPAAAFIGAFAGFIIGGVIGSLFGGTPRSGADAQWDENEGRFVTANAYSRKGGSQETAEALATSVAETFNGILGATDGRLENPGAISLGNYGQRKSDFVYRPTSTRDKDAITYRVDSSKDDNAFQKITSYGIYNALADSDFQIIGGSNYVKRAVYASFEPAGVNAGNFDQAALLGNIASAQAYESYINNKETINAIISSENNSFFAAETAINLVRAVELGLTKRHRADWFGGFTALFEEAGTNAANVEFGFDYDPYSDQISRLTGVGDFVLGDSIDIAGQTTIEVAEDDTASQTIDLRSGQFTGDSSYTINGEAADGSAVSIDVAATVDAGGGNDIVHASDLGDNIFGGDGNDTLYGGRLDDWLLGGDGDDRLLAGSQAGGLGGDGNYLNGGAGDDIVQGLEGSDWLEGGEGSDTLSGGAGDDILTGGGDSYNANGVRLAGDTLYGGTGDDSYLLRIGDGSDVIDDSQVILVNGAAQTDTSVNVLTPNAVDAQFLETLNNRISGSFGDDILASYQAAINAPTNGYVQNRYIGLQNGSVARDWTGYYTPGVNHNNGIGGGEDSVVLGQGIGVGDIRLIRSGIETNMGNDLIVQITAVDENGATNATGDEFTLTDWFTDPFKRIEWLKFADGNEIRISDITSFVAGTNGDDTLIGTLGNDFLYGGDGNDQLFLLAGDDVGSGGTGRDFVAGDSGEDLIVGGSGDDVITGNAGDDVVSGDGGNDDVYGGDGNDIVSGGRGNDVLIGGNGDDIFKYSRGDGDDIIIDELNGVWETVWDRNGNANGAFSSGFTVSDNGEIFDGNEVVRENVGTAREPIFQWVGRWDYDSNNEVLKRFVPDNNSAATDGNNISGDIVEFGVGINIQDIILREKGDDLTLFISNDNGSSGTINDSGDSITFKDWYKAGVTGSIEKLAFYATGELDLTQTNLVAGTDDNDALAGGSGADWITGGTGDDIINGSAGNDILSGNGGIDIIRGGTGDDVLYGGSGDDILIGGANSANGQGDILIGGAGSDTASYEDEITSITVSLANTSLNTGAAKNDNYVLIENLRGGQRDDILAGDAFENIIEGGHGDDILSGNDGNDTYLWDAGDGSDIIQEGTDGSVSAILSNGTLAAGYTSKWSVIATTYTPPYFEGTFEYAFQVLDPDGQVVYQDPQTIIREEYRAAPVGTRTTYPYGWTEGYVQEVAGGPAIKAAINISVDAGDDILELGEGITLADLSFNWAGNDLIITHGSNYTITLRDQNSEGGRIETLQFHDGLSANLGELLLEVSGDLDDNFIVGNAATNNINGNAGDDVIFGGAGNDTLNGGTGDDDIEGGAGADYLLGGTGNDTLSYRSSKTGQINVNFNQQDGTTAQTGGDAQGDKISGFENYIGSDQNRDNFYGDDNDNRIFGLGSSDILRGLGGDDVIVGGEGDDYLYGGNGDDNLSGGIGNDYILGDDGNDLLSGDDGNDRLYGRNGNDQIIAGAGDDYDVRGGAGNDIIDGGSGNDKIFGEADNDTIVGGTGDDTIDGGAGDDIFVLGINDGSDTITDTSGINTIIFGEGITRDKLWITQKGQDLTVAVIGGDTITTFKDFYSGAGKLNKIQTVDGTLFLNDPNVRNLIDYMSDGYGVGDSLTDLSAWPSAGEIAPADGSTIAGWSGTYINETEWATTEGPNGELVQTLHAGQEDGGGPGGGGYSDNFDIDGTKAYEFTYYFKNDGEAIHNIYFGLEGTNVKYASTGAVRTNPYFVALTPQVQNANFESNQWYKVVGYVLPEGSANQSNDTAGGIFNVTTGEKVFETVDYKWNENRTSDTANTRFFNFYGSENGYNTHFYKPEVREIGTAAAPDALPDWFADRLDQYWEGGETATPRAPIEAQTIEVINYGANSIILDGWPNIADTGRGENLVQDGGWPGDVDGVQPAAGTGIDGWVNGFQDETEWVSTSGPYDQQVVSLNAGQTNDTADGGGIRTNEFDIDKSKGYEFAYYFKADEQNKHRIYLGLGGTNVKNGHNGAVNGNPYFTFDYANDATGIEAGKWYKAVGYVLPEGSEDQPTGTYGGVYDTETGEKVRGVTSFRWNEDQSDTRLYSRFFNYHNAEKQGLFTHFYKPEVREIISSAILTNDEPLDIETDAIFVKSPVIEGWNNNGSYVGDGEARWAEVTGPNGTKTVVLEAGQFDDHINGGGQFANTVDIDRTKAYKYTQYVRKTDLDKHSFYAGLATNPDGKEYLNNGIASAGGYFAAVSNLTAVRDLNEDEWYKVVGYVLPAGTADTVNGTYGGIYDSAGNKVSNTYAFRWSSTVQDITAYARFFTYHDQDSHGWSTQFGEPSLSIIGDSVADVIADQNDFLGTTENDRNTVSSVTINAALGVTDGDNDIIGYELNPDGAPLQGRVEIVNAATGQIRYTPDADAVGTDNFSILVRDANDNVTAIPFNIDLAIAGINNAPDAPADGFALDIDENSSVNTVAGTLFSTDPDGDAGIDFRFADSLTTMVGGRYVTFSDDERFRLERDYGRVVLNEAGLDFENGASAYNYDILVSDKNSGTNSARTSSTLNININDVNEAHALNDVSLDINHYSRALGPFIPVPDDEGRAIDLRSLMLDDPEVANVQWNIASVSRNGSVITTHPWTVGPDGRLHLIGAIVAGQEYALTIVASDQTISGGAEVTAQLTLNVGAADGFEANQYVANYNNNFNYYNPSYGYTSPSYNSFQVLAPIVLDLDGDGVELVSITSSNVEFDVDGDGILDRTGWFGADDGLLVIDLNNDGIVNDGSEISFQRFVDGAFSDLEGLAFFDTNLNGLLDAGDAQFDEFGIWRDLNQDGVTDEGELITLTDIGLESISLNGVQTGDLPDGTDNVIYATSEFTNVDGTVGEVGDTFFVFESGLRDDTIDDLPEDPETAPELPEVPGITMELNEQFFDRKKKKYRLTSSGGELFIGPKNSNNDFDLRAGLITGNSQLHFKKRDIGLLSTIVLDLDGDGLETRDGAKSNALFDIDGNGQADDTGWAGRGDGFLVVDRNNDGIINDGSELSFMAELANARNGLQSLSIFDSNFDGIISDLDDRFNELSIWVDRNENGRTDVGELGSLADHGIASLSLSGNANDSRVKVGKNILLSTSTFTRTNGSTGTVGDTVLSYTPSADTPINNITTRGELVTDTNASQIAEITNMLDVQFNNGPLGLNYMRQLYTNNFDPFASSIEVGEGTNSPSVRTLPSYLGEEVINNDLMSNDANSELQTSDIETSVEVIPDGDAAKLALMIQGMSTFDIQTSGETNKLYRQDNNLIDYYVA